MDAMRRFARRGLAALALGALLAACCRVPCAPRTGMPAPGAAALLARLGTGDAEARYHAALALRRHDAPEVRERLRSLLGAEEPLTRNAAARALVELGEEDAAAVLIANLDRRLRTWMVTDAIHHLRTLYGTDRGYDPNLGYRHQLEKQEAWWAWWIARGGRRPEGEAVPADVQAAERYERLERRVETYAAAAPEGERGGWKATTQLWREVGELASSRELQHVALVARAFGLMARRFPSEANLWNNHALASLNDGRYRDAQAAYRKALVLAPDDASLHNDFGILVEGLGRLAQAEALYRAAIRLEPGGATWWGNLGDVLASQGRRSEALRAYREAERLEPEIWYYHRLAIERLTCR